MRERLTWYKTTIEVRTFSTYLHTGLNVTRFSKLKGNLRRPRIKLKHRKVGLDTLTSISLSLTLVETGIVATLQAQHATFLALASKTAAVDAELQKVKVLYAQLWRAKTGSVRDPFASYDKPVDSNSDLGMGSLHVR